jgi:hypothetical protein
MVKRERANRAVGVSNKAASPPAPLLSPSPPGIILLILLPPELSASYMINDDMSSSDDMDLGPSSHLELLHIARPPTGYYFAVVSEGNQVYSCTKAAAS